MKVSGRLSLGEWKNSELDDDSLKEKYLLRDTLEVCDLIFRDTDANKLKTTFVAAAESQEEKRLHTISNRHVGGKHLNWLKKM